MAYHHCILTRYDGPAAVSTKVLDIYVTTLTALSDATMQKANLRSILKYRPCFQLVMLSVSLVLHFQLIQKIKN